MDWVLYVDGSKKATAPELPDSWIESAREWLETGQVQEVVAVRRDGPNEAMRLNLGEMFLAGVLFLPQEKENA